MTDAAVSPLAALPELRSLNLKGTKITASGLTRLKRAKPICRWRSEIPCRD